MELLPIPHIRTSLVDMFSSALWITGFDLRNPDLFTAEQRAKYAKSNTDHMASYAKSYAKTLK